MYKTYCVELFENFDLEIGNKLCLARHFVMMELSEDISVIEVKLLVVSFSSLFKHCEFNAKRTSKQ